MKKILILSPTIDQAIAISKYIKKYDKNCILHGGFLPKEGFSLLPGQKILLGRIYSKVITIDKNKLEMLNSYDMIIPTGAQSTYWMSTHFDNFKVGQIIYSKSNIQCFDKIVTLDKVQKLGIPVPETYTDISKVSNMKFPLFYKQKFEKGGGDRGIVFSLCELMGLPNIQDLIFQEYIPGNSTFGVGFIAQNGEILTSFQHEEYLSLPPVGGSAVLIRKYYNEILEKYTERIVRNLEYNGWGLAEFKYCPRRRDFVFMEINAKLWASIEFAFMNNNKILEYLMEIKSPVKNIERAIFVHRLAALGIKYFLKNLRYFFNSKIINYYTFLDNLLLLIYSSLPKTAKENIRKIVGKTRN